MLKRFASMKIYLLQVLFLSQGCEEVAAKGHAENMQFNFYRQMKLIDEKSKFYLKALPRHFGKLFI